MFIFTCFSVFLSFDVFMLKKLWVNGQPNVTTVVLFMIDLFQLLFICIVRLTQKGCGNLIHKYKYPI
jgi:hypothetical protein